MNRLVVASVVGTCLASTILGQGIARAQDSQQDAILQSAKTDFEDGQILFIKEQFDAAAAKFLGAFDKKPFGAFLFNAAVSFEKAKKLERAIQYFEQYIDRDPEARDAKDVRARVDHLKNMLTNGQTQQKTVLPAIATKGLVIIDSKPQGASIYLDDKTGGVFAKTPWQGSLEPHEVKLLIEAKGFKPDERTISPRTDKVYEVYIALSEEHFLGWIEVAASVAGADVYLDDKAKGTIGKTPFSGHVKPGKHKLWVERPGYQIATRDIEVQPGTANTYNVPLQKVDNGWVTVVGKHSKGGKLKIDGAEVCATPCQHMALPGKHKVEVARPDSEPYRGELDIEKSTETSLNVTFNPKPPRSTAWTSAVISAVFVGAGTYMGLQSSKLRSGLKNDIKNGLPIDSNDPRVARGKLWAYGADAAFALGTVTGLLAVWSFLSSGPESTADIDSRAIGLAPLPDGRGGGLFAQGRF